MNLKPSQFETPAVRIVRAQAGDAGRIERFYLGLSAESRYLRFFSHHPRYTPEEIGRLSHPDPMDEICLIAVAGEGDDAVVVGDLRCVHIRRDAGSGSTSEKDGEIALVVADEWRRRGIARLLLCRLIAYARREAYTGLVAYVASSNTGMLKLIREFSFGQESLAGGAAMRVLRRALTPSWDDSAWQIAQPRCRGFASVLVDISAADVLP
jgi:GNAT superfamily N-acetyltransferase